MSVSGNKRLDKLSCNAFFYYCNFRQAVSFCMTAINPAIWGSCKYAPREVFIQYLSITTCCASHLSSTVLLTWSLNTTCWSTSTALNEVCIPAQCYQQGHTSSCLNKNGSFSNSINKKNMVCKCIKKSKSGWILLSFWYNRRINTD